MSFVELLSRCYGKARAPLLEDEQAGPGVGEGRAEVQEDVRDEVDILHRKRTRPALRPHSRGGEERRENEAGRTTRTSNQNAGEKAGTVMSKASR